MNAASAIHVFEAAGLGKAPFTFDGSETAEDRAATQNELKNAGKPYTTNFSTSCDYCGQGIQNAFWLKSADGQRFKVGCDCVKKTGDKGLTKIIDREVKEAAKTRRIINQKRKRVEAEAYFGANRARFEALPHPSEFRKNDNLADYIQFCWKFAPTISIDLVTRYRKEWAAAENI